MPGSERPRPRTSISRPRSFAPSRTVSRSCGRPIPEFQVLSPLRAACGRS